MAAPDISIVLPVFNEVESLDLLFAEITAVMDGMGRTWEVIACDDGSTDGSRDVLLAKAGSDSRFKAIFLMRNFGQTAALDAGFRAASGAIIVPMDADLQNDPADIPRLVARLDEGADLVSGWRANRHDSFLTKTLPSRIANKLFVSRVTGVRLHDYGCTMKAYRASFLKQFHLYGEMHRLIPAYIKWAGGNVVEEKVNHRAEVWPVQIQSQQDIQVDPRSHDGQVPARILDEAAVFHGPVRTAGHRTGLHVDHMDSDQEDTPGLSAVHRPVLHRFNIPVHRGLSVHFLRTAGRTEHADVLRKPGQDAIRRGQDRESSDAAGMTASAGVDFDVWDNRLRQIRDFLAR